MGIRGRFIVIVGALTSIAVVAIGAASYKFSVKIAMSDAREKGNIIFNYINAQRDFFRHEQRALILELVEKDRFYPELMSGFVVTRATWDRFKTSMPGYMFKQATIDPLWPDNKADQDELAIIDYFAKNSEAKRKEGRIHKAGEEYYFIAEPSKVDAKSCLVCHGDPKDAPKDQIEIYGTTNGYHWKLGDTVACFIVYIPIKQAMGTAVQSAGILVSIGAGAVLLALLGIGGFLSRSVVSPILALSQRAEEISLGKNLDEKIDLGTRDEIGMLAQSVNRLRISVQKMLERVSR